MPRSSAPRKKYKPKGILKDPLSYVLGGIRPASEDARVKRKILAHLAMQALVQGRCVKWMAEGWAPCRCHHLDVGPKTYIARPYSLHF
jgi:hypothetical protein